MNNPDIRKGDIVQFKDLNQEDFEKLIKFNKFNYSEDTSNYLKNLLIKINNDLSIEKIKVPAREIHKLINPTTDQLTKIPKNSIVKVIITDKNTNIDEIKKNYKEVMKDVGYPISSKLVDYFISKNIFNFETTPNYFPRMCSRYSIGHDLFFVFSFNTSITPEVVQLD